MQLNHPNIHTVFEGLKMALTGVMTLPGLTNEQVTNVTNALNDITMLEAAAAADPWAVNPTPALQAAVDALNHVIGSASA